MGGGSILYSAKKKQPLQVEQEDAELEDFYGGGSPSKDTSPVRPALEPEPEREQELTSWEAEAAQKQQQESRRQARLVARAAPSAAQASAPASSAPTRGSEARPATGAGKSKPAPSVTHRPVGRGTSAAPNAGGESPERGRVRRAAAGVRRGLTVESCGERAQQQADAVDGLQIGLGRQPPIPRGGAGDAMRSLLRYLQGDLCGIFERDAHDSDGGGGVSGGTVPGVSWPQYRSKDGAAFLRFVLAAPSDDADTVRLRLIGHWTHFL